MAGWRPESREMNVNRSSLCEEVVRIIPHTRSQRTVAVFDPVVEPREEEVEPLPYRLEPRPLPFLKGQVPPALEAVNALEEVLAGWV